MRRWKCALGVVMVALLSASAWGDLQTASYPTALGPGVVIIGPPVLGGAGPLAVVDYVDIGGADGGHNLVGWGPIEPATSGGGWGGEDDARVVWEPGGGKSARLDLNFGTDVTEKYLGLRWLDGIAYGLDTFTWALDDGQGGAVVDGSFGHGETWYDLGLWDVGPVTGTHTLTLTAFGPAWGSQGTYGQVAFSEAAVFVPAPGAVILGWLGLGLVASIRRRLR